MGCGEVSCQHLLDRALRYQSIPSAQSESYCVPVSKDTSNPGSRLRCSSRRRKHQNRRSSRRVARTTVSHPILPATVIHPAAVITLSFTYAPRVTLRSRALRRTHELRFCQDDFSRRTRGAHRTFERRSICSPDHLPSTVSTALRPPFRHWRTQP